MQKLAWLLVVSLAACSSSATPAGSDAKLGADVAAGLDAAIDAAVAADVADAQADTAAAADAVDASADVSATGKCPTAVVQVMEGDIVVPQTILHLNSAFSFADPSVGGPIQAWQWSVEPEKGSVSQFLPNDHVAVPTFQPNVAGDYKFCLDVWDMAGQKSCKPTCLSVKVVPDGAIAVQLYWPITPDAATNTQLDLHFAHPYAAQSDFDGDSKLDPWYDPTYDCFWGNPNPNWGSLDPNIDDDPHWDAAVAAQYVNMANPEDGRTYSVGVHYFKDAGFGATTAEVTIYVYGQLVWVMTSTSLNPLDLWYVATISWPDGEVTGKGTNKSGPFITPCYQNPNFVGLGADPTAACAKP